MRKPGTILLKVCGMREKSNILEVASLQPHLMGFIFYDRSPRFVGAGFEMPSVPAGILKVGVFVNEETDAMLRTRQKFGLDFLQLHGNETPGQVQALKNAGARTIKVFSVDDNFDFDETKPYEAYADLFLFDTKGKYHGGNAIRFDWENLRKYDQRIPFLLSGGITPENVADVALLGDMNIYALDINSGVEFSPAMKDPEKIMQVRTALKKINIDKTIAL